MVHLQEHPFTLSEKQWSESGGPLTLARFSRSRARLHSISPSAGNSPVYPPVNRRVNIFNALSYDEGMLKRENAWLLDFSRNVFSQTGEDIGEISEVRTDKRSGEVQFVTLTKGGVGTGGKDIAIPLGAFKLDREKERATLTVSEAMLENAPTQATKSDEDFQRELSNHYGIAPVWGEGLKTGETQKDHSRKSVVPNPVPGLETGSPHVRNKIE